MPHAVPSGVSDSEPEEDTPEGNACGTGEEASLGASDPSGAGRRINSSGGDLKKEQRSIFKYNRDRV